MKFPRTTKVMQGYSAIVTACILWGTTAVLAKMAFQYSVTPLTLVALKLAIGFSTLFAILALLHRSSLKIQRGDLALFISFGLFGVVFQRVFYYYSLDLTTATVASMLYYTYPIFVMISASLIQKKEKITVLQGCAIVFTFIGVALVVKIYDFSQVRVSFVGIVLGVLSSVFFAFYFLMAKRLRRTYSNLTVTVIGDGIGAIVLSPLLATSASQISQYPVQLWLIILTLTWVPSLLAFLLFNYGLKHVKASTGSMLNVLEPITTAVLSMIFLAEILESPQVLGAAIALAGIIVLSLKESMSSNAPKPPA